MIQKGIDSSENHEVIKRMIKVSIEKTKRLFGGLTNEVKVAAIYDTLIKS